MQIESYLPTRKKDIFITLSRFRPWGGGSLGESVKKGKFVKNFFSDNVK